MSDINNIVVSGRIGRIDLKEFPNGGAVLNLSVAQNYRFKKGGEEGTWEEGTNWHRVDIGGRRGEALAKFLQKGQYVVIAGELRYREVGEGADKKVFTSIRANDVSVGPKSNKTAAPEDSGDDGTSFPPGPPDIDDVF